MRAGLILIVTAASALAGALPRSPSALVPAAWCAGSGPTDSGADLGIPPGPVPKARRKAVAKNRARRHRVVRHLPTSRPEATPALGLGTRAKLEAMDRNLGRPEPAGTMPPDPTAGPFMGAQVRLNLGP